MARLAPAAQRERGAGDQSREIWAAASCDTCSTAERCTEGAAQSETEPTAPREGVQTQGTAARCTDKGCSAEQNPYSGQPRTRERDDLPVPGASRVLNVHGAPMVAVARCTRVGHGSARARSDCFVYETLGHYVGSARSCGTSAESLPDGGETRLPSPIYAWPAALYSALPVSIVLFFVLVVLLVPTARPA